MDTNFTENACAHILCILSCAYKEMSKKRKTTNLDKSLELDSTVLTQCFANRS